MKINSIRFKNLHSLKGEHLVNFNQEPFVSAGLFLICGPTGSGKSTLLDAMTLALYNTVARFQKKNSLSTLEQDASIMTHHTLEAWAEVEYETEKGAWRSRWSVAYNRNHKLNDYEMELSDLRTQDLISTKKTQIPELNEENIGLTYDQFVKTILLSQGEFAKFLKSEPKDRVLLLEHLSGTEIFRTIGAKIYEKQKNALDQIKELNIQVQSIALLSGDEVLQYQNQLREDEKEIEILVEKISALDTAIKIKQEVQKLKNQQEQYEKQQETIAQQRLAFQMQQNQLDMHEKALPFQLLLADKNNKKKILVQLEQEQNVCHATVQQSKEVLQALTQDFQQQCGIKLNNESFEDQVQQKLQSLRTLFIEEKEAQKSYELIQSQKKQSFKALPEAIHTKLKIAQFPETSLLHLEQELSEQLGKEVIARPRQEMQEEIDRWRQKETTLAQILDIEKQLKILAKEDQVLQLQMDNGAKEILALEKDRLEMEQLLQLLETDIHKTKEKIALAQAMQDLSVFRTQLQEGKPCPLCGSLHPEVEKLEHSPLNPLHALLKEEEKKASEQQQRLKGIELEIHQRHAQKPIWQARSRQILEQKMQLELAVQNHISLLSIPNFAIDKVNTASAHPLEMWNENIQRAKATLQQQIKDKDLYDLLLLLKNSIQEGKEIQIQIQKIQSQKNQTCQIEDFELYFSNLIYRWNKENQSILHAKTLLNKHAEQKQETENALNSLLSQLEERLLASSFQNMTEVTSAFLMENQYQEWKNKSIQLEKSWNGIQSLVQENQEILKELVEKNSKTEPLESLQAELESLNETCLIRRDSKTHIATLLALYAKDQARILALQTQIQQVKDDNWAWSVLNELAGDREGKRLSERVQQIALKKLMYRANIRLKELSPRYLLHVSETANAALEVIDTYMGNTQRSVKTLSGGETFLLSLALALGLSDMASKKVALGCLFIDEGFGTLDPETLDIAMAALEKLQSESNKLIGIISHVDTLKERIGTQIRMYKKSQGISGFEVIGL